MKSEKSCSKNRTIICSLVVTILVVSKSALAYQAVDVLPNVRIGSADSKFNNTYQIAAVFELPVARLFRAQRLEVAIGSISTTQEGEAFISLGPVWRLQPWSENVFLDFGFSPTILSGSTFNGRDAGGNLHFTTSMSIGLRLGSSKASSISLRMQHISNGGLKSTNPGLDMLGLEF